MKPSHARHRADTTSKALTAEARRLGVDVEMIGGSIDAIFFLGPTVRLVDFKTPGGTLTDSQAKLVARGCPIRFISTIDHVTALALEMRRESIQERP